MHITNEDIKLLLCDENVKEFLDAVVYEEDYQNPEEYNNTKEILINLILFLFYSNETKKIDWVQDILYVFKNNIFQKNYLAPCLKNVNTNNLIEDIKIKISTLNENGAIEIDNYCISYEFFNQYITDLYNWCSANFSTV